MKIAIVHDHLGWPGGGERTVLSLAIDLGADFITCFSSPKTFFDYQKQLGSQLHVLAAREVPLEVVRFFWQRYLFFSYRKRLASYDVLIASNHAATEAVAAYGRPDCLKILYNHTPPRRIYDLYQQSKDNYRRSLRPLYAVFARFWHWSYLRAIKKFDLIVANSKYIRQRFNKYTSHEVNSIIWPPIETGKFKWLSQGDYYLSWGRLDENKRIELIVEAFKKLPDQKLVIASGGPRLDAIKEQAAGHNNIKVLGWVDDSTLSGLVGNCRAAIYVPYNEDAGMTHLEANSAGKSVIGVSEGGLIESIVDGRTGVMIKADPGVDDLAAAINKATAEWCLERKDDCIKHAARFARNNFSQGMSSLIERHFPKEPMLGIDASRWSDPSADGEELATGVEVYSRQLIPALIASAARAGLKIRLYTPKTIEALPLEIQKVLPGKKFWTTRILSRELKDMPVDYFFTPAYYIPRNAPKNSFATVHDVIFKTDPQKYSLIQRLKQTYAAKQNFKRAEAIITVSDQSKSDIVAHFGIRPDKIKVVPPGITMPPSLFHDERQKIILYIGRLEHKKSVGVLIEAFSSFKKNHADWRLVLAGKPGFGYDELKRQIDAASLGESVELPGYINDETKYKLLSSASILVHPSSHEGFCFPLLEAWSSGLPAIVSDAPVLADLAGDAALLFHSGNSQDLEQKMNRLADDQVLAQALVEKGRERVKNYDWNAAADKIIDLIKKSHLT